MAEFFWPTKTATDPSAVTGADNLGTGEDVFAGQNGSTLEFKTLVGGTNVTLSSDANTITINANGGGGGGGDVFGPGSSTDNAITRWDGTGGTNIQDSIVAISDAGAITGADSITLGSLTASRALLSDGSKAITSSATTATEIGYVSGVTSAIQTQLNGKQVTGNYITATTGDVVATGPGSVSATIQADAVTTTKILNSAVTDVKIATGVDAAKIANGSVSNTEFQYLDGATSNIQTQLNAKEPTVTKGDLTGTNISVTGGTGAVIGSGAAISIPQSVATSATPTFAGATLTDDLNIATTKGLQSSANSQTLNIGTSRTGLSLNIGASDTTTVFKGNPLFDGGLRVTGSGAYLGMLGGHEARFYDTTGSDYVGLKAPAGLAATTTYSLPLVDGSSGQALLTNGSGVTSWGSALAANPNVTTVTSTYTTTSTTGTVLVSQSLSGFNGTVHTAVGNTGQIIRIKKIDSTLFTSAINFTSGQTADGKSQLLLEAQNQEYALQSDGANWKIIGSVLPPLILTATSSIKTPTGSGTFQGLTNNSITISAGTWEVWPLASFGSSGTAGYSTMGAGVAGSNGADNGAAPTLLSAVSNLTVNSVFGATSGLTFYQDLGSSTNFVIASGAHQIVTATASVTLYVITYCILGTPANGRITAYLNARKIY